MINRAVILGTARMPFDASVGALLSSLLAPELGRTLTRCKTTDRKAFV